MSLKEFIYLFHAILLVIGSILFMSTNSITVQESISLFFVYLVIYDVFKYFCVKRVKQL